MTKWGLGYKTLSALNPRLIMVSTSLMGQSGPWAAYSGYGNHGAAISGFQNIGYCVSNGARYPNLRANNCSAASVPAVSASFQRSDSSRARASVVNGPPGNSERNRR